jgi:hypothetical protein
MIPIFQLFGSKSSLDLDVCFFVDSLSDTKRNHEIVKVYAEKTDFNTSKKVNANLAIIKDGIVVENFKGDADELNNALFTTYNLHDQKHENHIQRMVSRNLESRIERCARSLAANFTRTDLRVESKEALKGNLTTKLDFLEQIELEKYTDFGKHGSLIEVYKTMAFQLGITIALMADVELYTKEAIIETFPELENYLLRKEQNSESLEKHLKLFIMMMKNNIKSKNQV